MGGGGTNLPLIRPIFCENCMKNYEYWVEGDVQNLSLSRSATGLYLGSQFGDVVINKDLLLSAFNITVTSDPLENYCMYHIFELRDQMWCYREPIRTDCVSSARLHSHQFTCCTFLILQQWGFGSLGKNMKILLRPTWIFFIFY